MIQLNIFIILSCISMVQLDRRYQHDDHYHPSISRDSPTNFLKNEEILRDRNHIKEDLKNEYDFDVADDISDFEMEFYYFQLHDLDKDGKLDGLELLMALSHVTEERISENERYNEADRLEKQRKQNEIYELDAAIIDLLFSEDDLNNDGYLTYHEFALSHRK
ncbi:multiple coagulation factor deficiency protein 2 homolog isoform X1 [Centruroides sculpturatus]|uniref:multiple coagulation factor deficiency protein 2 homolog isoform X1 n=1 Tax=Centruroides sculpturatus TaxID=218467 RepID=UPI000C6EE480|nr:multiple coagulation factor deficiency protein 2 homolog isoform X1 [Centruroides sculpturatus]XP_023233118.1 multiple coagulation factor deficiency protein 2 homolog isoform X1 [Centruroides sculpturatus]XP_023233119.1 multiple coagulation factor deficiency protein 2 homolog isoform X1 [Centruroides sculpturatus]